jgi:DNA-3-methyladenine glycosylase II
MYFKYGSEEIAYLKSKDKQLGEAIDRIGLIRRPVESDLFCSVVRQIIGQQISTAAQRTIWQRLCEKMGNVSAETICSLELTALQEIGITFKKAGYIKELAEKVKTGEFNLQALHDLPDPEVIRELSSLRGVGIWTAEMVMIFCMQRPDVVSYGDLAIHRGMRMLYHHRNIDRKKFDKYARRYSPHGTVAGLYLWAIAGGAIPEMKDHAPKKKTNAT